MAADDLSPAARLRVELAAMRAEGKTFDEAWQFALLRATHLMERAERWEWTEVLGSMRHIWRAAYNREPMPSVDALLSLCATVPR